MAISGKYDTVNQVIDCLVKNTCSGAWLATIVALYWCYLLTSLAARTDRRKHAVLSYRSAFIRSNIARHGSSEKTQNLFLLLLLTIH